jgi:hypothetical protein
LALVTQRKSGMNEIALLESKNILIWFGRITIRRLAASIYKSYSPIPFWRHVLELIIVIILVLLLLGSFPTYGYSRNWGYGPSGGLGTILLIVVILWLLHVI